MNLIIGLVIFLNDRFDFNVIYYFKGYNYLSEQWKALHQYIQILGKWCTTS